MVLIFHFKFPENKDEVKRIEKETEKMNSEEQKSQLSVQDMPSLELNQYQVLTQSSELSWGVYLKDNFTQTYDHSL